MLNMDRNFQSYTPGLVKLEKKTESEMKKAESEE